MCFPLPVSERSKTVQIVGVSVAVGVLAGGALTAIGLNASSNSADVSAMADTSEDMMMKEEDYYSNMDEGMDEGMDMMSASEFDYLIDMIPHHQEAIDNAQLLVDYSNRPEMQAFGTSIIETQSAEVEQMEAWLEQWYPGKDTTSDYQPMMGDLTALRGDELDERFLETMIPHHMMAVMMSQQLVGGDVAEHEDVVPFAANIRDTQREEIYQMREWLFGWFDGSYEHGSHMGGAHHMMGSTTSS